MPVAMLAMAAWSVRQLRVWARGGAFASGGPAVAETAAALALLALALFTLRAESGFRRRSMAAAVILFALCDYKVYGTNRLFNTRDGDVDQTYNLTASAASTTRPIGRLVCSAPHRHEGPSSGVERGAAVLAARRPPRSHTPPDAAHH